VKASIIIPSYNAKERLFLNLTALNNQNYEHDDVEVIVIDNGSNDDTIGMLNEFCLKYPMKVVSIKENKGIAHGRNRGILEAQGEILIFHDSDMIAAENFIDLHIKAHTQPNMVVCGMFWKRVFTFYYKKFNPYQINNFYRVINSENIYIDFNADYYPVLKKEHIEFNDLLSYSFDLDFGFITDLKEIIKQFGENFSGYYLPWRFFITNNLSVDRKIVIEAGMFDENIVKYGYEDYDLGVRLYKSGCRFEMRDDIISLHQEHPANYQSDDLIVNINYVCTKYNNIYFIDVALVCLSDSLKLDKKKLNDIVRDIYRLLPMTEFHDLLELFLELLQVMRRRFFSPDEDNSAVVFPFIMQRIGYFAHLASELKKKMIVPDFIEYLCCLFEITFNVKFKKMLKDNL
jgi:glycosyltransferase involved in cell wall biosynthesis